MPALQVKDFPNDLYEDLRKCAAAQDRNISQQTIHVLREFLQAYKRGNGSVQWVVRPAIEQSDEPARITGDVRSHQERRQRAFEAINALPTFEVPDGFPDSAELIRQMREDCDGRIVPELSDIR